MEKGSYTSGLIGALCGVLIALLAISMGAASVLMFGGGDEGHAVHGGASEHH